MLNQLIELIDIRAEVYHNAKVCGDWTIREHILGQTCFHMPTEEGCILSIPGFGDVTLRTGDLVIFPKEIPHTMRPLKPQKGAQEHLAHTDPRAINGTGMLCGRMIFRHNASEAILDALPTQLIVPEQESRNWLPPLLQLILKESYEGKEGQSILDRICSLVFIYALRHYSAANPSQKGVLRLYGQKKLQGALKNIHENPSHAWTLEQLAKCCNMSRTSFTALFSKQSGWTPMRYIAWWRMQLAYVSLSKGKLIAQVAHEVGYNSEAAFSRAFAKEFNSTPGQIRKKYL